MGFKDEITLVKRKQESQRIMPNNSIEYPLFVRNAKILPMIYLK